MRDNVQKTEDIGQVIETLPDATFKVKLDSGQEVIARISGRMRLYHIRILVGDHVKVERTPYDPARGRIVYRST